MKLIAVNVEQDKHLTTVRELIKREQADVVALMEVSEADLEILVPEYRHRVWRGNFADYNDRICGVAIVSKEKLGDTSYFFGDGVISDETPSVHKRMPRPIFVQATVSGVTLGAIHWTWTREGKVEQQQREDIGRLVEHLVGQEIVLCGDFNMPRNLPGGNELYEHLAGIYQDNIPAEITTTIDPHLHRVNRANPGRLALIVDYLWSTPSYQVSEVRVVSGVSDHCALVCEIIAS